MRFAICDLGLGIGDWGLAVTRFTQVADPQELQNRDNILSTQVSDLQEL